MDTYPMEESDGKQQRTVSADTGPFLATPRHRIEMIKKRDLAHFKSVLREQMPLLRERFAVESLGLFGSYVRGEAHSESDLDVLVWFEKVPGLLCLLGLGNYLSDLLGLRVDLVLADSLKPRIGSKILSELVPL